MSNQINAGTLEKHPTESRIYYFNFDALIPPSDVLTISPTVTADVSGLTIASAAIISADTTLPGGKVLTASRAVKVTLSGGTHGDEYLLACKSGTASDSAIVIAATLRIHDGRS